jgi:aminopeptidase N
MLRQEMGDQAFQATIREFYGQFRNKNALTSDFQTIAEKNANKPLGTFFQQWLWRGGHPNLSVVWQYNPQKRELTIECEQNQKEEPFLCRLEIGIHTSNGLEIRALELNDRKNVILMKLPEKPREIVLDPHIKLLFSGKTAQK